MTEQAGIDFVYYGNPSPEHYMIEQNGGGVALFDYDCDGNLDLFFANGSHFLRPAKQAQASNRLYRSGGSFQYEDMTEASGLEAFGFGMGCAAGDYDNDGFVDLFVAYYGRNRLWTNNGDGTFTEVTDETGVGDELWGASAAFADLDGDGNLDLYVVNYVEWSVTDPPCFKLGKVQASCSPMPRKAQADLLYQNLGNGQFEEIGTAAGIALSEDGKGLAVEIVDLNSDGQLDVYVANDTCRNFLFYNQGELRFREEGIATGVAVSEDGKAGSSMGIACADSDGDGRFDLSVTNFESQVNDFFSNIGEAGFFPTNAELGVDLVSRPFLGFGIVLTDFDLDGWPDMFVTNGHIWDLTSADEKHKYEMTPSLLRNEDAKQFRDVAEQAGSYFNQTWVGRAVAFGDLDNDGDSDLVVTHLKKPPALLRNDSDFAGGSLSLKLIGTRSARQPLGATVELTIGEKHTVTHVPSGGSFQVSHDDRIVIATAASDTISEVRVHWPGGAVETWTDVTSDGLSVTLIEGTGRQNAVAKKENNMKRKKTQRNISLR